MQKLFAALLLFVSLAAAAQTDSLTIHYYENFPYAYEEDGKLKGIEVDILNEYVSWMQKKKGIRLNVTFKPFSEFGQFYSSVKSAGKNVVGLGSVSMIKEREGEVSFSPPYLKNVAVLVTSGTQPTIKTTAAGDARPVFEKLSAAVVEKSSHVKHIETIKKQYVPALKVKYTDNQEKVLELIASGSHFGYVDIVSYWSYLKNHHEKFLKMQKVFTQKDDRLSMICPVSSAHAASLAEFFESGFGFTSTKTYHQILEKYLGFEVLNLVEVE